MIDFHAHFVPRGALDGIAGRARPPSYDPGTRRVRFPSGESRPVSTPLTDLRERTAWNRAHDVEIQVLSPWMDLGGDDLPPSDAIAWCRLLNDAAGAELQGADGFRLLAALPTEGAAAADELERCVDELGFAGAVFPTQVDERDLDAAGLEDLFAAADGLGTVLFLHPGPTMAPNRTSPFFLSNICGNPFETTLAGLRLYLAGVTERHSRARILLAHCGGALPLIAGRAAHATGRVAALADVAATSDDILRSFYYDTVLHDPAALAFAIGRIGAERMVLGTDVPFPMSVDDPAGHLEMAAGLGGIDGSELRAGLRATGLRLLDR